MSSEIVIYDDDMAPDISRQHFFTVGAATTLIITTGNIIIIHHYITYPSREQ